ncbi:MAG: MFS transporter [Halieaceae bacterium]|jgi:MFS family permease|nr:MFS transporter [Halieaceae bacterium]MBT5005955.1 MFS transporter [Halieaceae bacterium]MBT6126342.1 MFS transporter [Halieaceae bacterium]MBT7720573.1 MFS transporter [Halieaceae bacterium]
MNNQTASQPLAGHRTTLTLLVLAYTLSMCDRMILSILFPDIKAEFGLSDTQLGLLGGLSFALFYATMGLPIARLSDQHSRKRIIIVSLVIFSVMTAFSGLAAGFISLLLLRVGVGIGEAGVNPASHSIIADYFPPKRRGFAMATLMLGGSFGMILGFVGGGMIAEAYNWRIALVSVGVPGLLLAFFMAKLLREPARGTFETAEPLPSPPILTTAAAMWSNPAMRHMMAGGVIAGLMSYGLTQWLPTFFIRTHELSQSEAGMMIAGVFGISGAIGALVVGKFFDRLSIRGFQYGLWMLAMVPFVSIPLFVMGLFADNLTTAILLFIIPGFFANSFMGPSLAMVQTLSPVHMRAVSSAIMMLCLNLIGLGLGPLLVGVLSDILSTVYGKGSLSVALACFGLFAFWGSLHFWLCGRALSKQKTQGRTG